MARQVTKSLEDIEDLAPWACVPLLPMLIIIPIPSCWAHSGHYLTGQQLLLLVPPLGTPGRPHLQCSRGGPHPWPHTPAGCSSAGLLPTCRDGFHMGGMG